MKLYLSGKITGDKNYKNKFNRLAAELEGYGYTVFNPAILPDGFEYETYMAIDLLALEACDAIFLMKDWKTSPGAKREYEKAKALGLQIITEEDLKHRRILLQLCDDTEKVADLEIYTEEDQLWSKNLKELSEQVRIKAKNFELNLSEEDNLIRMYNSFNELEKKVFVDDFIKDSDKQIEYDMLDKIQTDDFDGKIRLAKMYETSVDLMNIVMAQIPQKASA